MPKFEPSILITDCWGSVGDTTFFHVDGRCYYKNKPRCSFRGTTEQLEQLAVHRRALAAWREVPHEVQLLWNELGKGAVSHRPPYDGTTHISGQNLFVSAYHGFYTLGMEHVPSPRAFDHFPPHSVRFESAIEEDEVLRLRFRVFLPWNGTPERYHLLLKLQLAEPGSGSRPGRMRNALASGPCHGENGVVEVVVRDFRRRWDLDDGARSFQAHCRHLLLDRETGYRNIATPLSSPFSI